MPDSIAFAPETYRLAVHTIEWPEISPVQALYALYGHPRWAWLDGQTALIAWDVAAHLRAHGQQRFAHMQRQLAELNMQVTPGPEVRLFGGFAFQPNEPYSPPWEDLPPAYFALPRYLLRQNGRGTTLTAILSGNMALDPILDDIHNMLAEPVRLPMPPAVHTVEELVSPSAWHAQIAQIQSEMQAGQLEKVVLARSRLLKFHTPPDPAQVFGALSQNYPDTIRFMFEPIPGHAFVGASPEILARTAGRELATVALAGSIGRGSTPAADQRLAEQLLASPKDRREHALVISHLRRALRPLCAHIQMPEYPVIRRLPNIQHLETPVAGFLHEPGILPVAEALHPTPAMGGVPTGPAMDFIRQHEPVSRGWYAAPVGVLSANGNGVFAAGIRSAAIRESQAYLFAGAGILPQSQAGAEWDEINLKFAPLMNALGASGD